MLHLGATYCMRTSFLTVRDEVSIREVGPWDPSPQNLPLLTTPVLSKEGVPKSVLVPQQSEFRISAFAAGWCTSKALKMDSDQDFLFYEFIVRTYQR